MQAPTHFHQPTHAQVELVVSVSVGFEYLCPEGYGYITISPEGVVSGWYLLYIWKLFC